MSDQQQLECPVCLEVKRDCQIFQCANGHLICSDCHGRVAQCPVCRVALASPGLRNLIAEQLIEKLPWKCRNHHQGCVFVATGGKAEMNKHLKCCNYKQLACPHMACNRRVPSADVVGHLLREHKVRQVKANEQGSALVDFEAHADKEDRFWTPALVSCEGRLYLAMLNKAGGVYAAWVHCLNDADRKEFDVGIKGPKAVFSVTMNAISLESRVTVQGVLTFSVLQANQVMGRGSDGTIKIRYRLNGDSSLAKPAVTTPKATAPTQVVTHSKGKRAQSVNPTTRAKHPGKTHGKKA